MKTHDRNQSQVIVSYCVEFIDEKEHTDSSKLIELITGLNLMDAHVRMYPLHLFIFMDLYGQFGLMEFIVSYKGLQIWVLGVFLLSIGEFVNDIRNRFLKPKQISIAHNTINFCYSPLTSVDFGFETQTEKGVIRAGPAQPNFQL